MSIPNEKVIQILNATPEQQAAIDRILAGEVPKANEPPVEPYIDKHEVGRRLNKSLRAIDGYMASGYLVYYKLGRTVVFRWSEVVEHLQANHRVCLRNVK
jgi:hypothetical protein